METHKLIKKIADIPLNRDYFPDLKDQIVFGANEWRFTADDVRLARFIYQKNNFGQLD